MFKRVLQVATVFGLLLAGFAVYVRGFALLVDRLGADQLATTSSRMASHQRSRSEQRAIEIAVRGFGHGHWTTDPVLGYRYYNADRRYWIYTRDYKRLNNGKQLEFAPFAIIWESRDGKSLMTATSDSARIDLDQPLGLVSKGSAGSGSNSGSMRVIRARVEGNVQLRDDKGTVGTSDDLRISFPGPVPSIEYDEAALEVRSDSSVLIEDRDLQITGEGLLIALRPREAAPPAQTPGPDGKAPPAPSSNTGGFSGARMAVLKKNVHVIIADVGSSGILPGNARPEQRQGEKTPLELRCAGMMQLDLPKPPTPVAVGPPAPQGPTIAQFDRNVEVIRGRPGQSPDQLDCDHLRLTLVNAEKPPVAQRVANATAEKRQAIARGRDRNQDEGAALGEPGPLRELTLQRAVANGHNVRITSASQGVKARCNELIHEKRIPDAPDITYFRGDPTSRLIVEKTDIAESGPNRGQVTSYTTIRTIDATMLDAGKGNDALTIVARGPGELESRPAPDRPVERSARWTDQLSLTDDPATAAKLGLPALKKVTLTGLPGFVDHPARAELNARDVLVVWLKPRADAAPVAATAPAAAGRASPSFELNRLVALKDVRLASPGKVLTALDRLDAVFEPATSPATAAPTPAPAVPAPAASSPAAPAEVAATNPEPDAQATARRVWALVRMRPSAGRASGDSPATGRASPLSAEIGEVRLRGAVVFHQDPEPGKAKGVDVSGEAVDLSNQGDGALRFAVFHHDPSAIPAAATVEEKGKAFEDAPLARVETEDLTITGQVIGLDQTGNEAWVDGRGTMTRLAARGLLSDRGLSNTPEGGVSAPVAARPAAPNGQPVEKVPMTISWADGMKFFGQSVDPQGRKAARAEFYKDVRAETDEALLTCSTVMRTYLDRTVPLRRPDARNPRPSSSPVGAGTGLGALAGVGGSTSSAPRADISLIECIGDVVVVNEKRDPASKTVAQKQRIEGKYLLFDKATGKFDVPGAGQVVLYERENRASLLGPGLPGGGNRPAPASTGDRADVQGRADRAIIRVADGPRAPGAPPLVGRVPNPLDRANAQRGTAAASSSATAGRAPAAQRSATPPLVVTQVRFRKGMTGRFGTGNVTDRTETRQADFFGDIEVVHGPVPDAETILDPDRLPRDAQFMTAQILRVVSEPRIAARAGDPAPPPLYLLRAWENAVVTTRDKTITADTITFDSEKQLFWAYGEGGRPVVVAQQEQVGLGFSNLTGRAVVYNHKTGEAKLIEPSGIAILDSRTGVRPTPVAPPSQVVQPRLPTRKPLRNPASNLNDRKGFRGGQ